MMGFEEKPGTAAGNKSDARERKKQRFPSRLAAWTVGFCEAEPGSRARETRS